MDQLKPVIEWCKKNIFWIGCFLLAVTMIGSWVFSSIQLAKVQKERQTDIAAQVKAMENVAKTTAEAAPAEKAHANESTKEGMATEIDQTISSIVKAWKKRYEEQKAILTWPEDVLGKETCNFFSRIDVPEKVTDPGQGFEKYRKAYYDRVPEFMNKICRNVGVNWQYDPLLIEEERKARAGGMQGSGGGGGDRGMGGMGAGGMGAGGMGAGGMGAGGMGGGGMGGRNSDTNFIDQINRHPVIWDVQNQMLWHQKLTEFVGFDDHSGTSLYPTYMQANMLQQDLWLLEAMFQNIKELNGGSTSNDTSVIRTIDHLVFGREAIIQLGSLSQIDSRLAGNSPNLEGAGGVGAMGMGGMSMGGMGGNMGDMSMGGMGGPNMGGINGPPGTEGMSEASAYDKRYVDVNFESIAASQVRAVLGGEILPELNLELIVAKRVPFRLAVEMDERKINEFVAICANSEFVFEVNQLRINRHTPGEQIELNGGASRSSSGSGRGGMGGMGGSGMGGPGMGNGSGMGGPAPDSLVPSPVESRTSFMVLVEFYGVVKIYNPVRENFLRKVAGQSVIDETADPAMVEPVAVAQPVAPTQPGTDATQPGTDATQPGTDAAQRPAAQPTGQQAGDGAPANVAPGQPAVGGAADATPATPPAAAGG